MREIIFRQRGRLAVVFFVVVLLALARTGKTLGLSEPAEDWSDLLGCLVAVAGHALRVMALRHIGPASRTRELGARRLAISGPYAIVRNPLYVGNWLIALGLCFVIQLRWLVVTGPLLMLLLYYLVALAEEPRLREQFGEEYRSYCESTPRFWPRGLFTKRGWQRLFEAGGGHSVFRTKEYQAFLVTAVCVAVVELHERVWLAR